MSYLNPHTHDLDSKRPKVITICGSTRFRAEMTEANRVMTLKGCIVLAPGVFGHDGDEMTDEQKTALDELHFHKIDLADEILVVNPGGYIGESTRREIGYAERTGKTVKYVAWEAPSVSPVHYVVWSNEHQMFWRPNQRGYTGHIEEAGRYNRVEATSIVAKATCDGQLKITRTNPITGEDYEQYAEVMVLAPEFVSGGAA